VIEDTKDIKNIQKKLNAVQMKSKEDDDDERDSKKGMDLKTRKKLAIEMEKMEEKENKKKAVELEKAEEQANGGGDDAPAGSAERITKILKMLEEEIVARSSKSSEPPAEPEKPCDDGMAELKKYFSGKEGLRRS
jgi:hypothetical protein